MVDMSRRLFLGGALALTGTALVPNPPAPSPQSLVTLYGDGIHDDTEGLMALLNGIPVQLDYVGVKVVEEGNIDMRGGVFLVSKTLIIEEHGPKLTLTGGTIKVASGFEGRSLIKIERRLI